MSIHAYAALARGQVLEAFRYEASLGPQDIEIAVTCCGICHSDIHMIDDDWGMSQFPLVAGHEIVGTVRRTGSAVQHLRPGQRVGVGWQAGSCLNCEWCLRGEEPSCAEMKDTIVGRHGGFADALIVDSRFAHPIPAHLSSEQAAPLLCAGITVYTPLRHHARAGHHVGVIGVGGLGHLAIQFARAFGCEVTAFSSTVDKKSDARSFGADNFVVISHTEAMADLHGRIDLLLSTVSVDLEWERWLELLRPQGTLVLLGASPGKVTIAASSLIVGQKSIRGSIIGGRAMMREMLEFAARRQIHPRIEVIPMSRINAALDRVRRNQARYRIVLKNE